MTPTNYSSSSGGFSNSLSRLNSLGLIKRNGGIIQLNPELLEIWTTKARLTFQNPTLNLKK